MASDFTSLGPQKAKAMKAEALDKAGQELGDSHDRQKISKANQKRYKFKLLSYMNMADYEKDGGSHRKGLPYWGVILIIIGVFALLDNLKIIPGLNWDIFWPVLLIFLGFMIIHEYYQKRTE